MSEVDYTQFIYKKCTSNNQEENIAKKKPKNKKTPTDYMGRSNKFFVFVVVLLCFGIVFLSVDFFNNGKLTSFVLKAFDGNSYNYYLVVSEHPSRELAYEQSAIVKDGGGSGYVWQDEKYLVVYSLYMDKSSAVSVANKNTRAYVKSLSYSSKKTEVFNFCNTLISTLSTASYDYEKGQITESELLSITKNQINEAKELKETLQKKKPKESVHLLNLAIESLNNINIVKPSKIEIISDIRYVCSSLAINMKNYI
ncbi:MAG: hypothetical protein GX242_00765 [Clostridiales bacterium]|nr:hypothetical protein [Clostridiales bacterium]